MEIYTLKAVLETSWKYKLPNFCDEVPSTLTSHMQHLEAVHHLWQRQFFPLTAFDSDS
jgi:hypothetical protein